jgi:hypothetical protein
MSDPVGKVAEDDREDAQAVRPASRWRRDPDPICGALHQLMTKGHADESQARRTIFHCNLSALIVIRWLHT